MARDESFWGRRSGLPALVAGGSVGGGASFAVLQVVVPAPPGVRAATDQSARVPEEPQSNISNLEMDANKYSFPKKCLHCSTCITHQITLFGNTDNQREWRPFACNTSGRQRAIQFRGFTCFPSRPCLKYWRVSWGWWGPRRQAGSLFPSPVGEPSFSTLFRKIIHFCSV